MSETKNRWSNEVGMVGYDKIMALSPAHGPLRLAVAKELARRQNEFDYVVDLGAGIGDSTMAIARLVDRLIVLVDNDNKSLKTAWNRFITGDFYEYGDLSRLHCVNHDLLRYLERASRCEAMMIPALTSSWTIHNFPPEMREKIFTGIAGYLRQLRGNYFILMDKIYLDGSESLRHEMLERAIRLFGYLDDKSLRAKMIEHERADFQIRMLEGETVRLLEKVGFSVTIGPRVERDLVLICELKD